jgi:hypothetical protein
VSRTEGGAYQSGGKPVEELKPPARGPGLGAPTPAHSVDLARGESGIMGGRLVALWPWFCGCCGRYRLAWSRRSDDHWCRPCRRHVLAPPGWT